MHIHVTGGGASAATQIPSHLTRTSINLISTAVDWSDKTVQGKVLHKGPLVSLGDNEFVLKTVIKEEDLPSNPSPEHSTINVVLFGAVAKEFSEVIKQGDIVAAAGFTVGRSPTVQKDKLHPCNLLLSGADACIYVSANKLPKYTYAPLSDLNPGTVVNVYGVVVFFKQPFKSRGTDFCSSLKITDQSNRKVGCNIFCEKLDDHPKIFQVGDIVRLHRVKATLFNGSASLLNTFGFSVVTFDGRVGTPVAPRTSAKKYHFDGDDRRVVEELRSWAATQDFLPLIPRIPLSAVQPKTYFDLTCQLLSKAPMDTTCTLLKVWDGTRCPHPLLEVLVEPGVTEGPSSLPRQQQNLVANVLVYDNHVEVARQLKPGAYLRIYNLHAQPGSGRSPGAAAGSGKRDEHMDHLAFHLHGGTSYGRGIRVLPDDSPDILELKKLVERSTEDPFSSADELSDDMLLDVYSTPPEFFPAAALVPVGCATSRTCSHAVEPLSLAQVKAARPTGAFHVRAKLKSYQPQRLFQALKLYCSQCKTMKDVPDYGTLAELFSKGSSNTGPCNDPWVISKTVTVPAESPPGSSKTLTLHLSSALMAENRGKELVFLMGSTLVETCQLAAGYQNIVPVRLSGGKLSLLDLSAPVLFRGRKCYYGCQRCSRVDLVEPCVEGVQVISEDTVAQALGVQLLQYRLLLKLELQEGTDTLEALLWRDAESFFHVSMEDVAANQEAQNSICETMDSLCPPGSNMDKRPWLDLCLRAYTIEEEGHSKACYQICHTKCSLGHICPNTPLL